MQKGQSAEAAACKAALRVGTKGPWHGRVGRRDTVPSTRHTHCTPVSVPFTQEAMPIPGSAKARADRAWTAPTTLFDPGVTQMYHILVQLAQLYIVSAR